MAREVARQSAMIAEREALVALLVAELERNCVLPCGRGLKADEHKLREQIETGKSVAASSGKPWM